MPKVKRVYVKLTQGKCECNAGEDVKVDLRSAASLVESGEGELTHVSAYILVKPFLKKPIKEFELLLKKTSPKATDDKK